MQKLSYMSNATQRNPQVAVLLPASAKICRDIRRGILKYAHEKGSWGIHILDGRGEEQKLINKEEWGCTGVIIRPTNTNQDNIVFDTDLPLVIIEDPKGIFFQHFQPKTPYCIINNDNESIGRMGALYFLEKKFKNFAFVDETTGLHWSKTRGNTFSETINEAGFACHRYDALKNESADAGVDRKNLCAWLKSLPKPAALMAAMDTRARQVIDACELIGINVPHEISVLGVDNDIDLCENTTPPLSSIQMNTEETSYAAAEYLEKLMNGTTTEYRVFSYEAVKVESRQSTAVDRINDPAVKKALDFIRAKACKPLSVQEVVEHSSASRRLLETHFRDELGHTIFYEIRRARLMHVCSLLKESDKSIGEITAECGFESESALGVLFRRKFGCTMSNYRKGR